MIRNLFFRRSLSLCDARPRTPVKLVRVLFCLSIFANAAPSFADDAATTAFVNTFNAANAKFRKAAWGILPEDARKLLPGTNWPNEGSITASGVISNNNTNGNQTKDGTPPPTPAQTPTTKDINAECLAKLKESWEAGYYQVLATIQDTLNESTDDINTQLEWLKNEKEGFSKAALTIDQEFKAENCPKVSDNDYKNMLIEVWSPVGEKYQAMIDKLEEKAKNGSKGAPPTEGTRTPVTPVPLMTPSPGSNLIPVKPPSVSAIGMSSNDTPAIGKMRSGEGRKLTKEEAADLNNGGDTSAFIRKNCEPGLVAEWTLRGGKYESFECRIKGTESRNFSSDALRKRLRDYTPTSGEIKLKESESAALTQLYGDELAKVRAADRAKSNDNSRVGNTAANVTERQSGDARTKVKQTASAQSIIQYYCSNAGGSFVMTEAYGGLLYVAIKCGAASTGVQPTGGDTYDGTTGINQATATTSGPFTVPLIGDEPTIPQTYGVGTSERRQLADKKCGVGIHAEFVKISGVYKSVECDPNRSATVTQTAIATASVQYSLPTGAKPLTSDESMKLTANGIESDYANNLALKYCRVPSTSVRFWREDNGGKYIALTCTSTPEQLAQKELDHCYELMRMYCNKKEAADPNSAENAGCDFYTEHCATLARKHASAR